MLRVVDQMNDVPGTCAFCGGNPPGPDGHPQQAIHAEGVDIDWGSNLYICWECVRIICDLAGRVTEIKHKRLQRDYKNLEDEHTKLLRKHGKLKKRATQIVEGKKAEKELASG